MWHLSWTPDPPDTTVVGIDEVGYGPLAGPVAMAGVAIPVGAVDGVRDSKLVSSDKDRRELADAIRAEATWVQVRQRGVKAINERGLGPCVREMVIEIVKAARKKFGYRNVRVVVDGKPIRIARKAAKRLGWIDFVVGADASVYQVAAASLVAKAHNDANLLGIHKKYPNYGFDRHRGYGTKEHVAKLRELGPCPAHRRKPVNKILVKRPRNAQRAKGRESEVLDLTREEVKREADAAWEIREFLSDWQRDFIGDVRRKLDRGAEMTRRQNWFIRDARLKAAKRARRSEA